MKELRNADGGKGALVAQLDLAPEWEALSHWSTEDGSFGWPGKSLEREKGEQEGCFIPSSQFHSDAGNHSFLPCLELKSQA